MWCKKEREMKKKEKEYNYSKTMLFDFFVKWRPQAGMLTRSTLAIISRSNSRTSAAQWNERDVWMSKRPRQELQRHVDQGSRALVPARHQTPGCLPAIVVPASDGLSRYTQRALQIQKCHNKAFLWWGWKAVSPRLLYISRHCTHSSSRPLWFLAPSCLSSLEMS